jgi:predicted nucleic acid-binding protein
MLKTSPEAFLTEVEARFVILPITAAVTRIAVEFPSPYPLDLTDRIIGATALDRGVPLVTKRTGNQENLVGTRTLWGRTG